MGIIPDESAYKAEKSASLEEAREKFLSQSWLSEDKNSLEDVIVAYEAGWNDSVESLFKAITEETGHLTLASLISAFKNRCRCFEDGDVHWESCSYHYSNQNVL